MPGAGAASGADCSTARGAGACALAASCMGGAAGFAAGTSACGAGAGAFSASCIGGAGGSDAGTLTGDPGAGAFAASSIAGTPGFSIATRCSSSFPGLIILTTTTSAATAASAGIATRHLRYHGIADAAPASRACCSARAISASSTWHRMQSAKCVSRRSRSDAANDFSEYAASESASAHSGVAGLGR